MRLGSLTRHLGTAVAALIVLAACGGTSGGGTASCNAKTATSASDCGGIDSLVAAAKKEGKLNVIALPPDWANYGAIIAGFKAKYGIDVTSANPNGSSQEEVDAIKQLSGTGRAPDVVDVGMKVALANTDLFAPYKVSGWADILGGQKESTGLWVQDYGGFMGIGYDSSKVPAVTSVQDRRDGRHLARVVADAHEAAVVLYPQAGRLLLPAQDVGPAAHLVGREEIGVGEGDLHADVDDVRRAAGARELLDGVDLFLAAPVRVGRGDVDPVLCLEAGDDGAVVRPVRGQRDHVQLAFLL